MGDILASVAGKRPDIQTVLLARAVDVNEGRLAYLEKVVETLVAYIAELESKINLDSSKK